VHGTNTIMISAQLIVLLSYNLLFYCRWLSALCLQFHCTCDQQYTRNTHSGILLAFSTVVFDFKEQYFI